MAVPTSGELSLFKLSQEKRIDDYNSSAGAGAIPVISVEDLVLGQNTQKNNGHNWDATNTDSDQYPNNSRPHSFSEWYGYDHDAAPPVYLEVKAYNLASFTTGTGTWESQLSGQSDSLGAFSKHGYHNYLKIKLLDNTFDQPRFDYSVEGLGFMEVWTGASDDTYAPENPMKAGWNFHGQNEEPSGTYYFTGMAGSVIYIHMYNAMKHESSFSFSNMYCQPRQ